MAKNDDLIKQVKDLLNDLAKADEPEKDRILAQIASAVLQARPGNPAGLARLDLILRGLC